MTRPTVLICDGSPADAARLRALLEADGSLAVVGVSPSGEHALESLPRLRPAIVAVGSRLPGMDAARTIEEIGRAHGVAVVALTDGDDAAGVAASIVTLPKPWLVEEETEGAARLRRTMRRVASTRFRRPAPARPRGRRPSRRAESAAVGIGASTGGPRALRAVLAELPADFPLPVLVVQHIADGFIESLAGWLDAHVALPVRMAGDGATAAPGVWLAPDHAHLLLTRGLRLQLDRSAAVGGHRPSVDVLLRSMAATLGAGAVAVMLSGMGRDGADGVGAVLAAGGMAMAQDDASAAVFGMPQAAKARGARTLAPAGISAALCRLAPPGSRA